ncbi:hypothetical protein VTO73DRAFT_11704 [Trametes versicolor]
MQDCFADRRPAWTVLGEWRFAWDPDSQASVSPPVCDSGTQKYHPASDTCAIANQDKIRTSFYFLSRVLCVTSHQWTCWISHPPLPMVLNDVSLTRTGLTGSAYESLAADGAAMTVTARSLVFAKAYAMPLSSSIVHKAEPPQKPEIIRTIRPAFHFALRWAIDIPPQIRAILSRAGPHAHTYVFGVNERT